MYNQINLTNLLKLILNIKQGITSFVQTKIIKDKNKVLTSFTSVRNS